MLKEAGIDFEAMAADIDEKSVTAGFPDRNTADPSVLTVAIAKAKANVLIDQLVAATSVGEIILITCDQVVSYQGQIREKPLSDSLCRDFLAR